MSAVTGRVFITINGKRVKSMPGATYTFGGISRKAVVADSGVAGFQKSVMVPTVDFTIPHTPDVSAKAIQAMEDVPVIFETDAGHTIVMENASSTIAPVLTNGGLKCQFQSMDEREEVSA